MEKMTIRQAVVNVCSRLRVGDKLKIYQIYDRVMLELKNSGYDGYPTQETVQRRFRENAEAMGMGYDGDDYVKLPPLTEDEKKAGQRNLFA